jgi:gluconolactonase
VPEAQLLVSTCLLEGPAATLQGDLYVADVAGNRIWRIGADGDLAVFREDSGRAIGHAWTIDGGLVTCEGAELGPGGRRRLVQTSLETGETRVLVDRYQGRRLNSPNDVTCDLWGRLYFTDPRYGPRTDLELDHESVYRLDPDGSLHRIISQPAIQRPNGLAVSRDAAQLYVVDSNHDVGGNRFVWAFDLDRDGQVTGQRVVYDFAPGRGGDGIQVDQDGNLLVCAGILRPRGPGETAVNPPGVYVIEPDGRLREVIEVPQDLITNCCFGGPDLRTLFVTSGHRVFHTRLRTPGYDAGLLAVAAGAVRST